MLLSECQPLNFMSRGAQTHLRLIVLDAEHPSNQINKGLQGNPSPPRYLRPPQGSDARARGSLMHEEADVGTRGEETPPPRSIRLFLQHRQF